MKQSFFIKVLSLFTFLNLGVLSSAAYHGTGHRSGATVSVPSYSDPINFGLYLALPAALLFVAVQQPLERKLEGRWRRDEPARKYSSIASAAVTLVAVMSPLFHSFNTINQGLYAAFLMGLAVIGIGAYKWSILKDKLPV